MDLGPPMIRIIKNTTGTTTIKQRNCNDVEHSAGLRPLEPGSRDILPRKDRVTPSTQKTNATLSFHDVTNCVSYARLATSTNVAQHCETQRNNDMH